MKGEYRRGFKKEAEELAMKVRRQLGLTARDRLDALDLARHVGVTVCELPELVGAGMSVKSLQHLTGPGRAEFSAAFFEYDGRRLIVANPAHSDGRQASNIVHEIAHLLLDHRPSETVLEAGCRRWDEMAEREADWLAGELLVPRQAALEVARQRVDVRVAAERFGVSRRMMDWRLNHSGARKQAERERFLQVRRRCA